MTDQKETKIEIDTEAIKKAITETVNELFMKDTGKLFPAIEQKPDEPAYEEEIPIYERLAPGEILIISRSKKGILVAANCDGECDIRYYNDSDSDSDSDGDTEES